MSDLTERMFADLDKVKARSGEGNEFFLRMSYWTMQMEEEREKGLAKPSQPSKD